ncbi:sensor histidine kinase [Actinoplanes sp. TFC3]|uniref:sensor histidine kinase n=1 Tax=Actinoplanes sp. TFC3 TaxID=1710355 RepID=UPI00083063C5|nr:histidine kinase [Actinoplanes sp. TFC3]
MGETAQDSAELSRYSFLLPAVLQEESDNLGRPRTLRDWMIDVLCFMVGIGWVVAFTDDLLRAQPTIVSQFADIPRWLSWADVAAGTLLCIALWWRRRWPVHLAIAAMVVGIGSLASSAAALIILFTVAVHRRFATVMWVMAGNAVSTAVFGLLRPETESGYFESWSLSMGIAIMVQLGGMTVRSRRELVLSLRDRAERAESEQQLRVAQARTVERNRIAREMHDVLAHRISLLSLHAGALEIKPNAPPSDVASAAAVIRASAHLALQDLREVISVLREPTGDGAPERPQPTLRELPSLAAESQAAGVKVRLDLEVNDDEAMPEGTGRTAYRIVQEGLTNARKHAPGTTVKVAVGGAAGDGLTITVRNPAPIGGPGITIPGTGTGLIGLAERATLAGGRLRHGRDPHGNFVLAAWLPWPE